MPFENATPRPWRAEGPDMFGDYNIQGPVDALAIGAVVTNMRQEAEVAANAELIVTAVNAHDSLVAAVESAMDYIHSGADTQDAFEKIDAVLHAALKMARSET